MSDPVPSIRHQGIVQQSTEVFQVSFLCSGKKAGEVDMTVKLNYTTVDSGIVETENKKTFEMFIRRECTKSGEVDSDDIVDVNHVSSSPLSRWLVVGLAAGLTLLLILLVGMLLLCRYEIRQRKLKMEFEEDLEMYRSRSSKIYKNSNDEENQSHEFAEVSQKGLFYSPPKEKITYTEGRGRSNSNGSDSSIAALIIPEEKSGLQRLEKPDNIYSSRDTRHNFRHKQRHRHERHYKGGKY